jgi:cytochrome oxidase Cu insertion factor (SCO1/SenC/PrrC family)
MHKILARILALGLAAGAMAGSASPADAQNGHQSQSPSMPKVGDVAPDFKLNYFDGNDLKEVSLSQYRGKKNVVLAFYIFAFTGG